MRHGLAKGEMKEASRRIRNKSSTLTKNCIKSVASGRVAQVPGDAGNHPLVRMSGTALLSVPSELHTRSKTDWPTGICCAPFFLIKTVVGLASLFCVFCSAPLIETTALCAKMGTHFPIAAHDIRGLHLMPRAIHFLISHRFVMADHARRPVD